MNSDVDNLASNQELIDKAKALQPNNKIRIVQKREVDRHWRLELGGFYGLVNGGDSYLTSRQWGASVDLHINPHWSLGLRYLENKNEFTSEGKRVMSEANTQYQAGNRDYRVPAVDYPINSQLAVISWYPMYGKISWFEMGTSQFDFYALAGAGQTKLASGTTPLYTAGGGMGMWWNQWLTSRLELRYQRYQDHVYTGYRNIDEAVAQLGLGILL
jgi:outer membrane beta-barrel protein